MIEVKTEWEWCAVNVFGWAYGETMFAALDALGGQYDGKAYYNQKKMEKTTLRLFKFPKGYRPSWRFYCPDWEDADVGIEYWLVEDNMREWSGDQLPMKMVAKKMEV